MTENALHNMQVDHYVFVKKSVEGDFRILLRYFEDMLIVGQDPKKIGSLKKIGCLMSDIGYEVEVTS